MFRVSRSRVNKKDPKGEDVQVIVWLGRSEKAGYRHFDDALKHVEPGEVVELMELHPNSAGAPPGTKTWHVLAAYGGRRAGRPEGMYYDARHAAKRSGNSTRTGITRARTIDVLTPDPRGGLGARVKVPHRALSDPLAPLVITSTRPGLYSVTCRVSGAGVAFFARSKDAKAALPELLPLTDWDRDIETIAHTPGLYAQVRAIERRHRGA